MVNILVLVLASCTSSGIPRSPESAPQEERFVLQQHDETFEQLRIGTPTAYYYYQLGTLFAASGDVEQLSAITSEPYKLMNSLFFLQFELAKLLLSEGWTRKLNHTYSRFSERTIEY